MSQGQRRRDVWSELGNAGAMMLGGRGVGGGVTETAERLARERAGGTGVVAVASESDVYGTFSGTLVNPSGDLLDTIDLPRARWWIIIQATFEPSTDVTADTQVRITGYGDDPLGITASPGFGLPDDERGYAPGSLGVKTSMRYKAQGFYHGGGTFTSRVQHTSPPGSLTFTVSVSTAAVYLGPA